MWLYPSAPIVPHSFSHPLGLHHTYKGWTSKKFLFRSSDCYQLDCAFSMWAGEGELVQDQELPLPPTPAPNLLLYALSPPPGTGESGSLTVPREPSMVLSK